MLFIQAGGMEFPKTDVHEIALAAESAGAVSFRRCKTKNKNGLWQIAMMNNKAKLVGFIVANTVSVLDRVYRELTKGTHP